ncbi:Na(+)/H(+) antiporter subunit B [Halarsenatibacter silvermanii]|uniref:Uncharacterized MnhB-related membrane protein n=1 Tax=Halarsenatibacter silvermanii TaxID=321763 RepID=A0A1G9KHB3_9FIRM|nr:hydrogenase subunit MbhD domain-containing protein [Halarsenatibacter silvermanii]SDL48972.1 Uncharacterized MnhB-related membrane protein [Halarsenatibacter silvermanii]
MNDLIFYFLLLLLVMAAGYALFSRNLLNSVVTLSIFSGLLVVILIALQAPDVALAEAVISAGIMTSFFIITISKTGGAE